MKKSNHQKIIKKMKKTMNSLLTVNLLMVIMKMKKIKTNSSLQILKKKKITLKLMLVTALS